MTLNRAHYTRCAGLVAGCLLVQTNLRAADDPRHLERTFNVSPGGRLVIEADRGSITATTGVEDKVQVQVFREVKHGSKKKADELLANHEVRFKREGNVVSIIAKEKKPRKGFWGVNAPSLEVRYEVSAPKRFNVEFHTAGGDVRLADLEGDATARTSGGGISFGKVAGRVEATDAGGDIVIQEAGALLVARTTGGSVNVQKAGGRAEVTDAGGDIRVKEAAGDVIASTTGGRIWLEAVKGSIEAGNAGGDIRIESVEHNVTAHTTSGAIYVGLAKGERANLRDAGGNVEIHQADGAVVAETTSGEINIHSVGGKLEARNAGGNIVIGEAGDDVTAQTTSGSVKIHRAKGSVNARDSGGDIRIDEVSGDATVRTMSGAIVLGLAKGKVDARDAGGEIQVAQARDAVTAQTTSGSIQVGFVAAPKANCRLEALGGGIRIELPRSSALDLDARSAGGEVDSELPVGATASGRPGAGELRGKINGGGPLLTLRARSGDIHLKASSPSAIKAEDDAR